MVINTVPVSSEEGAATEDVFAKERYVNEKERVQSGRILVAGTHTWQFRFHVPDTCATSLEARNGNIRYQLYLKIKNREKYNNFFIKPVTVIKTFDLNTNPIFKLGQMSEMNAACSFGTFRFTLRTSLATPAGAYAPGQSIKYSIKITEKTANKIEHFVIQFAKITKFKTVTPSPYTKKLTALIYERQIEDNGDEFQTDEGQFVIPSLPPTTRTKYLIVEYVLAFKARLHISATRFTSKVPIIIGTVPIRESLQSPQHDIYKPALDSGPPLITPPPAFERAMRTEKPFKDIQKLAINRVDDFLPMYPSYRGEPAEN